MDEDEAGLGPTRTRDEETFARGLRDARTTVPADLLAGVQRRATRRHRSRVAGGSLASVAALVAVVLLAPPVLPSFRLDRVGSGPAASDARPLDPAPAAPPDPGPPPAGAPPADAPASPLLTDRQVTAFAPGARARDAPAEQATGVPPGAQEAEGGWCGASALYGALTPQSRWTASWEQPSTGDPVVASRVEEQVLRWEGPDAVDLARDWVGATGRSRTECGEADVEPSGSVYRLLDVAPGDDATVVRAAAGVDGPEPAWRVRTAAAPAGAGSAVLLTVVVPAPDTASAAERARPLLSAALRRARAWDAAAPRRAAAVAPLPVLTLDEARRWRPGLILTGGPEAADAEDLAYVGVGFGVCGAGSEDADLVPVAGWSVTYGESHYREEPARDDELYVAESVTRWDGAAEARTFLESARTASARCRRSVAEPGDAAGSAWTVVPAPAPLDRRSVVAVTGPSGTTPLHRVSAVVPSQDGLALADVLVWVPAASPDEAVEAAAPLLASAALAAGRTP